jgi:hypothetical protein
MSTSMWPKPDSTAKTEGLHVAGLGHVARHSNPSGTCAADQVRRYGQFLSRAGGEADVPSPSRQPDSQLSPDPTPGPGYQRYLPPRQVVASRDGHHGKGSVI